MENNDQQQVNMDSSRFEIVPYDPMLSKAVARMWRDSKEQAQGFPERFDFDSQHAFVRDKLCCDCVITLVIDKTSEEVVAMLATGIGTIEQLYVHQDFQGLGIGTKLLSIAKSHSPGDLQLYTLECNKKAQQFYEKHGFRIQARGFAEHEQVPDILYSWTGD